MELDGSEEKNEGNRNQGFYKLHCMVSPVTEVGTFTVIAQNHVV